MAAVRERTDISTGQVPGARDRMSPIEGKLTWIPIGSGQRPDPDDHLAYWNPCDGLHFGYWDEADGFMTGHPFTRRWANDRPGDFEKAAPIGEECSGFTHYAVLNGPADPDHDIGDNWRLYNAGYKTPSDIEYEKSERLLAATGLSVLAVIGALEVCGGDEQRALEALKKAGGLS